MGFKITVCSEVELSELISRELNSAVDVATINNVIEAAKVISLRHKINVITGKRIKGIKKESVKKGGRPKGSKNQQKVEEEADTGKPGE